jgi:hypothetical protein
MGKGAYTYEGNKKMSASTAGMNGKGRMSSAHGLNTRDRAHAMRHPEGRVGADCPSFNSGPDKVAGPVDGGGAGHHKQPKGHGYKD